jgi:hypothetical protein
VIDEIGSTTYCQLNTMLDADYPKAALNYWKSSFLAQLSDGAIDTMIECFARCPSPLSELALEHIHGAVTRVWVGNTAFPHRAAGYNFLVLSQWLDRADTDRCIAWARDTYAAMRPFLASGRYVNYLDHDDDVGDQVAHAYGAQLPVTPEAQGHVRFEQPFPHEPERSPCTLSNGYRPRNLSPCGQEERPPMGRASLLCDNRSPSHEGRGGRALVGHDETWP